MPEFSEDTNPTNNDKSEESDTNTSLYECNICLDTAKEAVVSMCGHLFCWPCLHQWLETRPTRKLCPVCKAGISKEKVIPLYGRDNTEQKDPRDKVPPRPQGQRFEPENNIPGFSLGEGGGFHFSFGIGAFPFGLFASTVNMVDGRQNQAHGQIHNHDEVFLNRVFIGLAFILFFWLMIA